MGTLKEMRGRLNVVAADMATLYKKERTPDEETKLDQILAEFNDLAPQVERLASIEAANARAGQLSQSRGTVANPAESLASEEGNGRGAGGREIDRRSVAERFAASDQVRNFLSAGRKQSDRFRISSTDEDADVYTGGAGGDVYDGDGPVERYTLVTTGSPQYLVPPMIVPDIKRPRDYALRARDVLMNGRTTSDTIYFLRELLFTNNAVEVAQATATTGSSGTKPESALTFEQASAPVATIAHWIPITRQALADAAQLQSYIENRLFVGLERRFNSEVWQGDGTGSNITGILNTSNIQVLDNAAFTAAPTKNAGTDLENFERFLRAGTEIELTGNAQMTFGAMNPRDVEKLRTVTNDIGQYIGASPFVAGPTVSLWGYPIVADRAIPQGTVVAGDGTMAAIWDREDANILIDTINDQFVRNMLTILAEMRAALTVFRPQAFAAVTLASW